MKSLRRPRLTLESLDAREAPALLSIGAAALNQLATETTIQPVDSTGNPVPPAPPAPGTGQTTPTTPAPGTPTPPAPPGTTPT